MITIGHPKPSTLQGDGSSPRGWLSAARCHVHSTQVSTVRWWQLRARPEIPRVPPSPSLPLPPASSRLVRTLAFANSPAERVDRMNGLVERYSSSLGVSGGRVFRRTATSLSERAWALRFFPPDMATVYSQPRLRRLRWICVNSGRR